MKKLTLLLMFALLFVSGLMIATRPVIYAADGCGIKPIKPIPPIGCKDLVAECICDANAENCRWEWRCAR